MAKTRETFCNTFFLELFVFLVSPITIFYEQFVKYVNYCLNQGLQSAQVCTYVFVYTENDLLHNIITERTRDLALPNKDASSMSTNALRIIGVRRRCLLPSLAVLP